jgi:hypothetical protein
MQLCRASPHAPTHFFFPPYTSCVLCLIVVLCLVLFCFVLFCLGCSDASRHRTHCTLKGFPLILHSIPHTMQQTPVYALRPTPASSRSWKECSHCLSKMILAPIHRRRRYSYSTVVNTLHPAYGAVVQAVATH